MTKGETITYKGVTYEVVGNDNPLVWSCILCDALCDISFRCLVHCDGESVYMKRVEDEEGGEP